MIANRKEGQLLSSSIGTIEPSHSRRFINLFDASGNRIDAKPILEGRNADDIAVVADMFAMGMVCLWDHSSGGLLSGPEESSHNTLLKLKGLESVDTRKFVIAIPYEKAGLYVDIKGHEQEIQGFLKRPKGEREDGSDGLLVMGGIFYNVFVQPWVAERAPHVVTKTADGKYMAFVYFHDDQRLRAIHEETNKRLEAKGTDSQQEGELFFIVGTSANRHEKDQPRTLIDIDPEIIRDADFLLDVSNDVQRRGQFSVINLTSEDVKARNQGYKAIRRGLYGRPPEIKKLLRKLRARLIKKSIREEVIYQNLIGNVA